MGGLLGALESIGAAVEPVAPGVACFDAQSLLLLHGGLLSAVLAAARRALGVPVRLGRGAVPLRRDRGGARHARAGQWWSTGASAKRGRSWRRCRFRCCGSVRNWTALPEALERLGVGTLGELAALPVAAVADRFGTVGGWPTGSRTAATSRCAP